MEGKLHNNLNELDPPPSDDLPSHRPPTNVEIIQLIKFGRITHPRASVSSIICTEVIPRLRESWLKINPNLHLKSVDTARSCILHTWKNVQSLKKPRQNPKKVAKCKEKLRRVFNMTQCTCRRPSRECRLETCPKLDSTQAHTHMVCVCKKNGLPPADVDHIGGLLRYHEGTDQSMSSDVQKVEVSQVQECWISWFPTLLLKDLRNLLFIGLFPESD